MQVKLVLSTQIQNSPHGDGESPVANGNCTLHSKANERGQVEQGGFFPFLWPRFVIFYAFGVFCFCCRGKVSFAVAFFLLRIIFFYLFRNMSHISH